MKKIVCIVLALFVGATMLDAQNQKELAKERKEITKQAQKDLNKKAGKTAKKEAKRLAKEGWTVTPGQLPLEKQLDKAFLMQYEVDENNYPKYIIGEAMSIGENYDAAFIQAQELAKLQIASQIQAVVTALVENTVANKQLQAEDAASITETVAASKTLISQRLGRVIPVVQCYRVKTNKNKEVMARVAYNAKMARDAAVSAIRDELKKKGEDLHKKLDSIICDGDSCTVPAK